MLARWENALYGLVMVGEGLVRFLSAGLLRPGWITDFALWRLTIKAEALEEEDDEDEEE